MMPTNFRCENESLPIEVVVQQEMHGADSRYLEAVDGVTRVF